MLVVDIKLFGKIVKKKGSLEDQFGEDVLS